ncbi:hypothetical protein [Winogradskyella forsetii]|uniref:hypothetical protein n=1 Tax=Winogradskyella forsetii TaxID=2686077 RepID=UPI0015C0A74C|nr:hypothetical protein [Winogradskyella forsetii]
MKNSKQKPSLAQNRIDYIVYHNTDDVSKLLFEYGFEAPEDPKHLAEAIKELARKKGRKVIKELIQIHPDKEAILKLSQPKEDNFCGACSNDSYNTESNFCKACGHSNYSGTGDEDSFLNQFESYSDKDLERYYQTIVKRSNAQANDKNLAQEVQMVWNEVRIRKEAKKKEEEEPKPQPHKTFSVTKDELLLFGVVFIAGALVGHGLKFNFSNVK